ncbi:MAG: hypothetical protein AB8G11_24125 [Saprospiraceae bacterium]
MNLILFVFIVLVVSSCCKIWSNKNTKKCNCKEFESYIKTWKTDKETGIFYLDISIDDKESMPEVYERFIGKLDCLKGKTVGEVRKLFKGKPNETEIKIPASRECAACFMDKEDCKYAFQGKIVCGYFRIMGLKKDDTRIIKNVSESLTPNGHQIQLMY